MLLFQTTQVERDGEIVNWRQEMDLQLVLSSPADALFARM